MNTEMIYFCALLLFLTTTSCGGEPSVFKPPPQVSSNTQPHISSLAYDNVVFTIDYKFYLAILRTRLNWYQAYEYCKRLGMLLASPISREQNRKLKQAIAVRRLLIESHYGFWISLHDMSKYNTYSWLSTGTNTNYTDWSPNEPNHKEVNLGDCKGIEHCVEIRMKNGKLDWNDLLCCIKTNFICEK